MDDTTRDLLAQIQRMAEALHCERSVAAARPDVIERQRAEIARLRQELAVARRVRTVARR